MLFAAGFAIIQSLMLAIALVSNSGPGALPPDSTAMLVATLLLVPVLGSAFSATLTNYLSPRRLFDARVGRPLARLLMGTLAAAGAIAPMTLAVFALADYMPDTVATGACAALAGGFSVMLLPRRRAGFCVHCGYDLIALPVCPECGAHGSA